MTGGYVRAPAGYSGDVAVVLGQRLLAGIANGAGLAEHRRTWPAPPHLHAKQLVQLTGSVEIRGRGGAGFPFGRKLSTAVESGKRRFVVVNASEGEPGSAKDSALMLTAPHLVLDGAEAVALALGVHTVRVVVPGERPAIRPAVELAISQRHKRGVHFELFETSGGFVGGQARAVLELIEGRENLPVTAWQPEAMSGLRGRPTLLSNAETFAQVAALVALGAQEYARTGTPEEPGTTLLTVAGDGPGGVVLEVPFGARMADVLARCGYDPQVTVLMGGYHGTWLTPEQVLQQRISRAAMTAVGANLGAGIVLPLDADSCPVVMTARVVAYLAGQSARRCGPCKNGLPALAHAADLLASGGDPRATDRMREVAGLVTGRGACAHPDGTTRIVRSLLATFPLEVTAHEHGVCRVAERVMAR